MTPRFPPPGPRWVEFPGFCGTIEALRLPAAHPAALRFPSFGGTTGSRKFRFRRRYVRQRRTWSWSPGTSGRELSWRRQDLPCSWGTPIVLLPCSPTPADRSHQAFAMRRRGPHSDHKGGYRDEFSGLNDTALALAVYALPDGSPHRDTRLASGCWPSSTGRAWLPARFR
jgi:hypothetical protein